MPSARIVIPDDDPVFYGRPDHPQIERLRSYGEVVYHGVRPADLDELYGRMAEADAVINVRGYSKFTEEAFARLPRLKMVSVVGTGVDNFDLAAASRHGVAVCNTPGINYQAVAELALGLTLAVARHLPIADRQMRQGLWIQERGPELAGKTVGILGLGLIGQRFAQICTALGMRVIAWSFNQDPARAAACGVELVDRDELFRQADVVSLHIRSTPETLGFVGRRELALMKPTAILVNTARGAVVDAEALRDALVERRIFGAGLDVHVPEPYPLEQNIFKDLDNVVLLPHLGGSSWEAAERTQQMTVDNVIAFLEGRPEHVVNP
jgi:D-3-phosphoglycerate dehydrogenase